MNIGSIIYLVLLLGFLVGSFIFFIIMDLKRHKKDKYDKVNKELEFNSENEGSNNENGSQ